VAIKGITDKEKVSLPRIAKIRLGVRSGDGGYPKDVDHFVLTDCPEVAEVYGENPKKLMAMFAWDDEERNFSTRAEAWKSGKTKIPGTNKPKSYLFCSSDGETANRIYTGGERDPQGHEHVQSMAPEDRPDLNEMFQLPCPLELCPYYEGRDCKPVGRLNFFLPQVEMWYRGVYQIETSSMYAFGNVKQFFNLIRLVNKGRAAGVVFELSRDPVVVVVEGKSIVKHVLNLKIPAEMPKVIPAPFLSFNALEPAKEDTPEDLFPPSEGKALPPAPEEAAKPIVDDLQKLAEFAGVNPAQLELMKAKCKGDVAKIRKALQLEVDKSNDINEVFPPDEEDGPKPQTVLEF